MFLGPFLRFLMEPVKVGIQLVPIHSPHTSAAELDRREASRADQCIDLGDADAQIVRHVLKREEARLQGRLGSLLSALGNALRGSHRMKIAPPDDRYLDLFPFAPVWRSS